MFKFRHNSRVATHVTISSLGGSSNTSRVGFIGCVGASRVVVIGCVGVGVVGVIDWEVCVSIINFI
ncbi:hypothetical protein HQ545_07480 [Candidatus Woesearchaeota archaeon]|nr:hypothetical protein [Candidatus Woesearchaeota archaeon]